MWISPFNLCVSCCYEKPSRPFKFLLCCGGWTSGESSGTQGARLTTWYCIQRGKEGRETKSGAKLCSWLRIFMLVISDVTIRQGLSLQGCHYKNISIRKASLRLKESKDSTSHVRIWNLSICLILELVLLTTSIAVLPSWWVPCQQYVKEAGERIHVLHLSPVEQVRSFSSLFWDKSFSRI